MNKSILFQNKSDEIETKRISDITKTLLLISISTSVVLSIIEVLVSPVLRTSDYILCAFTGLLIINYIIYRYGKVNFAGTLYVIGLWLSMTLIAWVHGGARDISIIAYIISLYTSFLIAQKRLAFLLSFLSIVSLWCLFFAENNHLIIPTNSHVLNYSFEFTVILIIIFALIYLSNQSFELSYFRIRKEYESRLKAEGKLQIREILYQTIFENANDAIFIMKEDRFIECNHKTLEIFGCTSEQILNNTPYAFSPLYQPDDRLSEEKALEYIHEALNGNPQRFEWQHCRLDKTPFDAEVSLNRIEVNDEILLQALVRDVTKRKQAEFLLKEKSDELEAQNEEYLQINEELIQTNQELLVAKLKAEESEAKLSAMFESSRDAIGVAKKGIHIYANPSYLKLFGFENNEQIIGTSILDSIAPSHRLMMLQNVQRRSAGESVPKFYEARGIKVDGTEFDAEFSVSTYELNGEIYSLANIRNITERKKAENNLKISEEKFSKLFLSSPDAILLTELKSGKIIEVNTSFEKFSGYSRNELIGHFVLDLNMYSPDDRQKFVALLKEHGSFHDVEFNLNNKEGNKLLVLASAELIEINDETHTITILHDITERRQAEQKIRESEERFRLILENMPILLNAFDEKGNIIVWNKACEEVTGFMENEVIGNQKILEILYPDPEYRAKVWNASLDPKNKKTSSDLVTKNGNMKTVEWFDIYHNLTIPGWNSWGLGIDITERKMAEKALQESEERYRLLVENIPIGMVVSQKDEIVYANSAILNIMKASPESDVMGKSVYDFIPQEYLKKAITRRKNLMVPSQIATHEVFKIIRFDKTLIDAEVMAVRIIYNGKPAILNLITDITERKLAEEKLRESEERFRDLANLLPQAVFETDLSGKLTYANQTAFYLFGYSQADFSNDLTAFNMILPEERDFAKMRMNDIIQKTSLSKDGFEYTAIRKNGSTFPVMIYTNAIIHNNQVIGLRGVIFNIKEIKMAEQALKESEERLQKLLNSVTDYIFTVKIENDKVTDTFHGEGCIAVTGYSTQEFKSDNDLWHKIIYENDRDAVREQAFKIIQNIVTVPLEHRIIHKNGSIRWVRNTPVLLFNPENKLIGYDGLIEDITELKEAQRQILSATIEAEERERNYFARELHDGLGPLLSSIKLYFQWFNKPELQTPKEELLANINSVIQEAITSVKEISHKLSPHVLMNFGLIFAVKSFIEKLKDTSRIKINLKTNIEQRLDKDIEITLYRVIIECINNTLKYAKAKKITISIIEKLNQIIFDYTDNGIGFTYDETVKSGKGLGLFNMQNRIATLGGNFFIKTQPGKGVKIKVTVNT